MCPFHENVPTLGSNPEPLTSIAVFLPIELFERTLAIEAKDGLNPSLDTFLLKRKKMTPRINYLPISLLS